MTNSPHQWQCVLPTYYDENDPDPEQTLTTWARRLIFSGFVERDRALQAVEAFAAAIGATPALAAEVLDAVWVERVAELAAYGDEPGDDAAFEKGLAVLSQVGYAVRIGLDCCSPVATEQPDLDHGPEDKFQATASVDDLILVPQFGELGISFTYLEDAFASFFPEGWDKDELYARANEGDTKAQTQYLEVVGWPSASRARGWRA